MLYLDGRKRLSEFVLRCPDLSGSDENIQPTVGEIKTSSAKYLLCFCRLLHNILSLHIETKNINMASFRKEILGQIERIDTGRIFTFRDLSFETEKTANVAVLLSEQSRKGVLVRVEKGRTTAPRNRS